MVKREKANYLIQSVSHALDVLEELCKARGEIGVTELSKRLKLHKNNVFRILATLELRGYVEQNPSTENYRLGVRSLQLGQAYILQSSIVDRAMPILTRLSETTGETVSFAVLQNTEVAYPVSIASSRPVKVNPRIGQTISAKQSAAGRLLTAQLPDNVIEEIISSNSPQDAAIKSQLNELRSSGRIIDKGGIEADVVVIAQIVRGINREVIGAIEILAPQYRAKAQELSDELSRAATELSQAFGQSSTPLSSGLEREVTTSSRVSDQLGRIR